MTLSKIASATPTTFYCWIKDDSNIHVEPGTILTTIGNNVRIIGIVNNIEAFTSAESPLDDFYGSNYGNPEVEPPTERAVIRLASVEVIHRSDGKTSPPSVGWKVYFADEEEIQRAYNSLIEEDRRILIGFTFNLLTHHLNLHVGGV